MTQDEERLATMGARPVNKCDQVHGESAVFLCVPVTDPIQELVLTLSATDPSTQPPQPTTLSSLEAFLQKYIALQPGESVDMELIQRQADEARQCTTYMCPHVSPLTLQRSAAEGTLQRVVLDQDNNTAKNDAGDTTTTIYLYYDESANLKGRPRNGRAMEMLQMHPDKTGNEQQDVVHGDVFVTKVRHGSLVPFQCAELTKFRHESSTTN